VEKIAFSETRDYVRRILSGYWICRTLYGGRAPGGLLD
jgi:soluble lytic murein transglycosylase-like protein